jgi:hypothetical protein
VAGSLQSKRDPRIDFLRGAALLTIFIDHVPGNFLGTLTLRNFGFSDAAELFVLLAGFSSMLAYGRVFERAGTGQGLRRVGARCLRIYLFQVGLLLTTLATFQFWITNFGLEPRKILPLLHGMWGFAHGLVLHTLPSNLNILPLYIILLAIFPLLWFGIRRWPATTMLASAGLWLATNLVPDFNLTNGMDGQGWYFNPFAWQFLFAIGVLLARLYAAHDRSLPGVAALRLAAALYLGFALLAAAPWTNWGIDWRLLDLDPDKTTLAPLRLINILALLYVLMCSPRFDRLVRQPWLRFVEICGRHSLEVFSIGTLISLIGRLLFRSFGMSLEMQLLVNGAGFACMIGLALLLERPRGADMARPVLLPGAIMRP